MTLVTVGYSPAQEAATQVLNNLDIVDPPVTPQRILEGLHLSLRTLPAFDMERLTPEQRRNFGSVRALLSPAEKRIYLRSEMSEHQKRWPIYHETGHAFIEW